MPKIKGFSKDVEKTRTIEFVFSDETRDSYGTVFPVDGWDLDRFNKNGIAFYQHASYSSDPDMAIGSARAWVDGKRLLGSITFEEKELNPTADKIFRKYLAGTLKGVSIRFNPLEQGRWGVGDEAIDGKTPTYYFGRRELVEISSVSLPSNKNALVRSIGKETEEDISDNEGFFVLGCVREMEDPPEVETQEETPAEQPEENDREIVNDEDVTRAYIAGLQALANVQ